jgi:PEP-CTERM motif
MNSTSAQNSTRNPQTRGRVGRLLPATLIILLLTAVPALAEPVRVNQVVQTLTSSQGVLDLRLKTLAQDPAKGTQQNESVAKSQGPAQPAGKTESIFSSVIVSAEGKSIGVEDIEEGEVEGTICDCGEILIAGGGFAKWPFLFLAAVPVVFVHDCDDCDEQTDETPTPTPPSIPSPTPTTPTPEPASLFLFGSGLLAAGAGLRRRYGKAKNLAQMKEDE